MSVVLDMWTCARVMALAAACLLGAAISSGSALAIDDPPSGPADPIPEDEEDYIEGQPGETAHTDWMGAFWGLELRGGAYLRADDRRPAPSPTFGFGLRAATLLTLLDVELYGQTTPFTPETDEPFDLWRTSLGAELKLHPLFLRALHANLGAQALAGIHLALGIGCDLLTVDAHPGAVGVNEGTHATFSFAFGLGGEIPIASLATGGPSLWIGLGWRMRFADFQGVPRGFHDMDSHEVLLGLGLRFHNIGFMRLPRPPELRDQD